MRWSHDSHLARPAWRQLGGALLLVAVGCLLSIGGEPWFSEAPLAPFYGVVAASVWYGGIVGGLAATALSLIAYSVIVLPPLGSWSLTHNDIPRIVSFLIFALLISLLGISRDRAEAELRGSERRLRTMLETANEGIWLVDRDGRTRYANDRMAAMLGVDPDRIATATVFEYVFPDDLPDAKRRFSSLLAGQPAEFDFRLRRANGQEISVLVGSSPVRDGTGRVVGALGFLSDVTARRGVEEALSRANERYALAVDAVQSMIFEWDVGTGEVDRSVGLLSLTGFRPDEAVPNREWWIARVHPEDVGIARALDLPRECNGDRYERQYRLRHRDGRWRTVWEQGRVVRDERGQIARVIGSVTDISGRTAAEEALRLLNEAGRVLSSSLDYEETLQRVAGLAVPALADWCFVDLLEDGAVRRVAVASTETDAERLAPAPADWPLLPRVRGPMMQVIESGFPVLIERVGPTTFEDAVQDPDIQRILAASEIISFISVPLAAGGQTHGALSLLTTDRSDRLLDQANLQLAWQLAGQAAVAIQHARLFRDAQTAEDRYRGLFEGTKDGIMVVGQDGSCLDANVALIEMTGYSRDDLVGNPASLIVRGGPWSGQEQDRLLQEGQWRGEFELSRQDGSLLTVESWITRVSLPIGRVFVGVLRDVSERKRFERMQEEFLSSLAHDLKNPLTALRGQAQLMLRRLRRGEPANSERFVTGLESIDAAGVRMTRLLDELTDVTRLRAGQEIDLDLTPTDLVELARRTTAEYQRTTERHRLELRTETDALTGLWDGPRLERVIGNLLVNAIKYSPRGGEITVHVHRDDSGSGEAVLSVTDRGVGIPEGDRERIFERFQRAGNVERFAGSGIGLAGARRIVELHGGTISVTSREGEGSTFTVRLPIAAADA